MNRKQTIDKLLRELYSKKYRQRIRIELSMENILFKHYITHDWRFISLFNSYLSTHDKISIEQFYENEINNLFKFINDCLLDVPQEYIYVDEKYPFNFEVYDNNKPDFDDFTITMNTRHLRKIGKSFNHLTAEEIQDRFINDLQNKIKVLDEQYKAQQRLSRTEHIKKVNEQKKKHIIITDKVPGKYKEFIGKEFDSVNDAAEQMNISRMTISRWISSGKIKC